MDLKEIAQIIGAEFNGSGFDIKAINTLKDATKDEISFVSNSKYIKDIQASNAGAIIVNSSAQEYIPDGCIALVVDNPYWEIAVLSKYFAPPIEDNTLSEAVVGEGSTVSSKAELANGAVVGKNCTIMAHAYVGANALIGDNTVLYPSVTVYRDCVVGNDCIIHSNTTIGSDGFGFATNKLGEHKKIYQNGNVVVEDDVEIGSAATIDRAVFASTIIKKGSRLDNQVHIAHNCIIGEHSALAAQVGIAGSSELGRNMVMGGQSAVSGHLTVAPFTTLAGKSAITKSIKQPGLTLAGFPSMEHRIWLKLQAKLARLIK